jgi:LAO/AO transport system kinase
VENRFQQSKYWLYESVNSALLERFYNDDAVKEKIMEFEADITADKISSFIAAHKLLDIYFSNK